MATAAASTIDLNATPRHSDRVVSRIVSGEHILVPLASRGVDIDSIFNLNGTGTFIWECIDGAHTVEQIASRLANEFQVTKEQATVDCRDFLAQLLEVSAIEFSGKSEAARQ